MSEGENNSLPEREEVKDSPIKDVAPDETNNVATHEDKTGTESEDVEMEEVRDDKTTSDVEVKKNPKKSPKKRKETKEEKSEDVDVDKKTDGDTASRSPIKSHKKKKIVVEDDEDDEEDEEPRIGLLEQPVVLEAGQKRERKKVERIEIVGSASQKDKTIEIPEGSGEKLGDIPRVEFKINRTTADDLKPFHRILYNRFGSITEVKRNIRKFCGFAFKASEPEYEKKKQHLNKLTLTVLKSICELLDLERKGTKEDIVNRIMTFLLKPVSSGKALPKPKRKRSSTGGKGSKQKTKSKGKAVKKVKSRSPKKKAAKSKEEVDEDSDQEEEEDQKESEAGSEQNEDSDNEDQKSDEEEPEAESEEEEETPKRKKQKRETVKKTPAKKETKKTAKRETKKPTPKKTPSKSKKKAVESASEDEASSDDEPLVAKKKPPTDDELRDVIKKILDHADLQEVTMKTVCKQVYDKYPDFDLVPRKDFIKTTVKQIIR